MTGVWFARIDFDAPLREAQSVIRRFLEARPDDRWALVRYELPQSERHLAAAVTRSSGAMRMGRRSAPRWTGNC